MAPILFTGANGEIGHNPIARLAAIEYPILTIDITPLESILRRLVRHEFTGSIAEVGLSEGRLLELEIDRLFAAREVLCAAQRAQSLDLTVSSDNKADGLGILREFCGESSASAFLISRDANSRIQVRVFPEVLELARWDVEVA